MKKINKKISKEINDLKEKIQNIENTLDFEEASYSIWSYWSIKTHKTSKTIENISSKINALYKYLKLSYTDKECKYNIIKTIKNKK